MGLNVVVFSKQVQGEWRIAMVEDAELKFEEAVPPTVVISGNVDENLSFDFKAWTPEDLDIEDMSKSVVIWQWCRGVPESQGNIMALDDSWWCPYPFATNAKIEEDFTNENNESDIQLQEDDPMRRVFFSLGQPYARQINPEQNKERLVRRVVKTFQELKVMLDKMNTPPIDITELLSNLPDGSIPHHFFCTITQDIMADPVKTIDGHTYDRPAIQRWFQDHDTSPLTGLSLSSKGVIPHTVLKTQITDFIANLQSQPNPNPA